MQIVDGTGQSINDVVLATGEAVPHIKQDLRGLTKPVPATSRFYRNRAFRALSAAWMEAGAVSSPRLASSDLSWALAGLGCGRRHVL
jgi:hypothetical protein